MMLLVFGLLSSISLGWVIFHFPFSGWTVFIVTILLFFTFVSFSFFTILFFVIGRLQRRHGEPMSGDTILEITKDILEADMEHILASHVKEEGLKWSNWPALKSALLIEDERRYQQAIDKAHRLAGHNS